MATVGVIDKPGENKVNLEFDKKEHLMLSSQRITICYKTCYRSSRKEVASIFYPCINTGIT